MEQLSELKKMIRKEIRESKRTGYDPQIAHELMRNAAARGVAAAVATVQKINKSSQDDCLDQITSLIKELQHLFYLIKFYPPIDIEEVQVALIKMHQQIVQLNLEIETLRKKK